MSPIVPQIRPESVTASDRYGIRRRGGTVTLMTRPKAGLAIRVLGPLEVTVDGSPLVVDTRKALAILSLLAVERRPFARDELAALLWPESDDASARGALRRTLSVLRAALGDRWVRADRSTVSLDLSSSWIDLDVVEAAAGRADLRGLRAAAEAARGPFLAGFSLRDSPDFDDWRATRAVAAERAVASVLDALTEASEAEGDLAAALGAATRRVDLDPLDEPSHRRLIALLARSGDRAGAIRQYRACIAILERELGVAPLAETTELYEAIRDAREEAPRGRHGATTAPPAATPAPGSAAPVGLPLIGRDAELATITGAWSAAGEDGRVVLLRGEAGIGKSRLAEAAGDAVQAGGGRVLLARAYASESGIAYGPVVALLRAALDLPDAGRRLARVPAPVVEELARLIALPSTLDIARPPVDRRDPTDPAARVRLLDAVATCLAALADGPKRGLVAVEDVQWADDATREAIAWLARRLEGRAIVLLLTWRPEDLDDAGAAFTAGLERLPGATVLELERLDRAAVAGLVAAASTAGVPPGVDDLMAASEGLPLFVVEALLAGDRDEPGLATGARSVKTLLRERLASVGETATQVLAAAAVIGRSFDLALVRGTSGRSEDEAVGAIEELVRRGIVRELDRSGASFDFAHATFRDAAYEATSLARRRLLHGRAADLLRAEASLRDDPGRLALVAGHERAAGRDADAARSFRDAGERARTLSALHEAATLLETALALGHPDVAAIQVELGEIRTARGDYAGAIAALEAAAAVADQRQLPGIEVRLGRVHARRGDDATAASHLDAAIEILERAGGGDDPTLARALVERSLVAIGQGRLDLAEASARRARELADALGDPSIAGASLRMLGLAARERGDLDGSRSALRESLALGEADPDPGSAVAARNALALVEASAGDRATAIGLLEAAIEVCRRTGEIHLEAAVENNLADMLHAAGREPESMEHLKRAVALFADVGGRPGELEPAIWKLATW
jgi:DNA-binding SARP family transcriptional activator